MSLMGMSSRSKLLKGSMGRNEWVGILVKLEVDIGLVSRELLGRGGIFASIEPPLKFVTVKG